jgi:hypothetical protein
LPSIELRFFLELTRINSDQSLAEFYTIFLETCFQVASEMSDVVICSSR